MTDEHNPYESTPTERLSAYIKRRKIARGLDVNEIHGFDVSGNSGFLLRLSDIEWQAEKFAELERQNEILSDLRVNANTTIIELERQLAEADRRAGAAEREAGWADASTAAWKSWRRNAKIQWGVDDDISFDVVWAECLELKSAAIAAKEPS